jgi:glutathione S-transferase
MKLYNSVGPNPHVVRMFLAEKGVDLPKIDVDLRGGENRRPPYSDKINVAGQTPALELDDGAIITEITVICEYLDEKHPSPALVGSTPEQRAETRMWVRRIDLNICEPLANGFRAAEGRPMFESRMKLVGAEGAAELKAIARDRIMWLDAQIAGRDWIVPGRFSLADILLFCFLAFGGMVGQPIPDEAANIKAWFARVQARPSAAA